MKMMKKLGKALRGGAVASSKKMAPALNSRITLLILACALVFFIGLSLNKGFWR